MGEFDLDGHLESLVGQWMGRGQWTTPDGKTRDYVDDRAIHEAPSGGLSIRTRLTWLDEEDPQRDFHLELANISAQMGDEIRMRAMSPQRNPLSVRGRALHAEDGAIRFDLAGTSPAPGLEFMESACERIECHYEWRGDELSWSLVSSLDLSGLADRRFTYRSVLRRNADASTPF